MKFLLTLTLILISITVKGQDIQGTDSLNVRILNKGKFYIKKHRITIDGKVYQFSDIWKHKYSEYQKVPYLWPSNKTETTVIIKRMIKYDEWMTSGRIPIDHVGESKINSGNYTLIIKTRKRGDELIVESQIEKE